MADRREGEHAWAVADVRTVEGADRPRPSPRDGTPIAVRVIALLVLAGAGVAAWQLVSLLR
jgi:hypothetical protein